MTGSVVLPFPDSGGLNHPDSNRTFEPPVTKTTLSELDVTTIIYYPKLRDDINFDPELHFRPNLDGIKGQRKQDAARLFWATLQEELQNFKMIRNPHTRSYRNKFSFQLLEYIKGSFLSVVGHSERPNIPRIVDAYYLARQLNTRTKGIKWLADFLRIWLKHIHVLRLDDVVDRVGDTLSQSADTDSRAMAEAMQPLLDVLESTRSDIEKYQMIRNFVQSDGKSFIPLDKLDKLVSAFPGRYIGQPVHGKPSQSRTLSARASEWTIYGEIMGNSIAALPDSGADACFISPETTRLLGLEPQLGTERLVKLANGKAFMSPGSVNLSWNFLDEEETFDLTCWILPGCAHQLILGSKFLEETKSLTTLRRRIRRKYVSVPKSVCVKRVGEGKQRLWGYLNGDFVAALPDTGSDVMIISRDYARRLGLKIEAGPVDIVGVEFADGTSALTDGIVRDAVWSSADHSIRHDFLVLNNLCVDIVLSKDYLFEMDVFSKCRAYLTEDDDIHNLDICGIRLVRVFGEKSGATLNQLENDSIEDGMRIRTPELQLVS